MKRLSYLRVLFRPGLLTCLALLAILLLAPAPGGRAEPASLQFKDQEDSLISGPVRVLCFSSLTAVSPFADLNIPLLDGQPVTPLPANCNYLAALRLRHSQPAGKRAGPAYQVYATSWEPGASEPQAAAGDVILSDLRPLTLFDVVASLAWTPAPASAVTRVADIYQALHRLSAELYDWTEGQMAIGPVGVHSGGERWAEADLRFLPANDKRPSAFVGGIVPAPLAYSGSGTVYTPAATYYGRLWDGRDAFVEGPGRWTEANAYRTIAHEWAHYALFLYDAYQNHYGGPGYCTCATLPTGCGYDARDASAMAYHYQATEFWHQESHPDAADFCYETWQYQAHGQTDWDTLSLWHTIQGLALPFAPLRYPAPVLVAGPSLGLAGHLFGRTAGYALHLPLVAGSGGTAVPVTTEPVVNLLLDSTTLPGVSQPSQVYLLKGDPVLPDRILPQGRATGDPAGNVLGSLRLLDVQPGDTVRAYVTRPGTGGAAGARFSVGAAGDPSGDIILHANPLPFSLRHYFELLDNRVVKLTLSWQAGSGVLGAPMAQLCSLDAAVGCHPAWQTALVNNGSWWQAQFIPLPGQAELPRYLVVRLWDSAGNEPEKELIQWLQVAGGVGPTHNDGMAPLLDDVVMVNAKDPIDAGDCNVVSYMPASDSAALADSLPPGIGGLIGIPLDITILLNEQACPPPQPGQPLPLPFPLVLNLGYSQDEVDRLGINEQTQLFILRYVPQVGWAPWQQIGVNAELNWIAAAISDDGIYAVGWMAP